MGNGEYLVDFSFSIEKIMMPSDEIGKIMMEMWSARGRGGGECNILNCNHPPHY